MEPTLAAVATLAAKLDALDLTPAEVAVLDALLDRAGGAEVAGFAAPGPRRDRMAVVLGLGLGDGCARPPSFDEADTVFGKVTAPRDLGRAGPGAPRG